MFKCKHNLTDYRCTNLKDFESPLFPFYPLPALEYDATCIECRWVVRETAILPYKAELVIVYLHKKLTEARNGKKK